MLDLFKTVLMKKFLFIFLLFFSIQFSAQVIEKAILLKDVDTNLPIEDATILVMKPKLLYLTNSEGKVNFKLNGISNIQITHPSYIGITIRSIILKDKETIVLLKSNENKLEEIILTKQHPQKILINLITNSIKTLTVPARLKVYSREFFKLNGVNTYYNDGLINFQLFSKSKKFNSNILVEQNRSFGLVEDNVNSELLGYNLNDIMENYYNFKYLNPILDAKAKKEYDFIIKGYSDDANYYKMTIIPLEEAKGLLDNYTIIYDYKKKLIIEVNSVVLPVTIAKTKDKKSIGSRNIYKSIYKSIYRFDGNNYYLLSSKEEIGFERIDKNKKTEIEVKNYLMTTNFSTQNYSFKESEVFKDKTLFNKKNEILSDYWNISGLTATEEEKEIIEKIEKEQ